MASAIVSLMSDATTTTKAAGIYEREARHRKTLRLCMSIDGALSLLKVDPFSAQALEYVLACTDAAWKLAASHARVAAPSALTKLAVEHVYVARLNARRSLARIA